MEIDSLGNAGNTLCSRDLRSDSIGSSMGCCHGYTLEGENADLLRQLVVRGGSAAD